MLIKEDILDKRLLEFDLLSLSEAIVPDRDLNFKYLGLQIIYDRYLNHVPKVRRFMYEHFLP